MSLAPKSTSSAPRPRLRPEPVERSALAYLTILWANQWLLQLQNFGIGPSFISFRQSDRASQGPQLIIRSFKFSAETRACGNCTWISGRQLIRGLLNIPILPNAV